MLHSETMNLMFVVSTISNIEFLINMTLKVTMKVVNEKISASVSRSCPCYFTFFFLTLLHFFLLLNVIGTSLTKTLCEISTTGNR